MGNLESIVQDQDLSSKQVAAIKLGIELGRTLQEEHPEIAEMYRGGKSQLQIARELGISETYGVSERIASAAIHKTLNGHNGNFRYPEYPGLITDELELEKLAQEHIRENGKVRGDNNRIEQKGIFAQTIEERRELGRTSGLKNYANKTGYHGRTKEQRIKDARKGGRTAVRLGVGVCAISTEEKRRNGLRLYRERIGIHGLSREEKARAARKSVISRGQTPFVERQFYETHCNYSELEVAYMMGQSLPYRRGSTKNLKKISAELNNIFHNGENIRRPSSLATALCKYEKNLTSKT
tara:strand:- start:7279 stop:8166 length:888 start_codon:yes stop_codon:yes gene_type:complete